MRILKYENGVAVLAVVLQDQSRSPMIVEDWRRGSITRLTDSKAQPY